MYTHYTGVQQDVVHDLMYDADTKQKQHYLDNALSLPTYAVNKYNFEETKGTIPAVDEYLSVSSPEYANITGRRLFITPNLFNRTSVKLPDEDRKYDICFPESFIDVDTINIKIPPNYSVEMLPKPVSLSSHYGT